MEYELVIGLEVHVELSTKTKMYCGCSTEFGGEPNSHVCPICLALPGALPRINKKVIEYTIKSGIALNCSINKKSRMDRKNYFYPDCPKNYQITQHRFPLCRDGYIEVENSEGEKKKIGIERIHMEEDAAKLIHTKAGTLINYNRAGVPLIEVVSKPDIRTPEEATCYLQKLKNILRSIGVSNCKMEQGSLRCDGNMSIRPKGSRKFGVKVEIKNVNSFKALEKAFEYEYLRQVKAVESGEKIVQETRRWNESKNRTEVMRAKEQARDYRYFPEGDLTAINISNEWIEDIRKTIPELPYDKVERFTKEYNVSKHDAEVLILNMGAADFFEKTAKLSRNPKAAFNWIMGDISRLMNEKSVSLNELKFKPEDLVSLIKFIDSGMISNNIGKEIMEEMFVSGAKPEEIIEKRNFLQNSSEDEILQIIKKVMKDNPKPLEDYKNSKKRAIKFMIGLVMKETKGKANPKIVNDLVNREFNKN
ncbi:Asp-tRNA(Asn)/Glu-tRNA(Gln) amidotransferase subunit GatB [Clostridium ljungdahlii]|uniref:Asp-tRNA(Asn)/Glu-tRNA(Gln) amidotransferase subunit GatB n=1 Tax=Clostridium ljungdahlii TaxID=1538 RepID=UPI00386EDACE